MALLERIATLVKANLTDLIDKAEDPEKMLKQVILDMENQFVQVKTQVAIAIADEHVLRKKLQENEEKMKEWMRKAEMAVDKNRDDLARAALEHYKGYERLIGSFREQLEDQKVQAENLKSALAKLDQKLAEGKAKQEMLLAQQRRAKILAKASQAQGAIGEHAKEAASVRFEDKAIHTDANGQGHAETASGSPEEEFARMEKMDELDRLLAEVKSRRGLKS
ncbi:MAG: PspA/IM30 family protein [Terriglobia bacterium]